MSAVSAIDASANPPKLTVSQRERTEIRTLQYARGLAALFVCLFHYEPDYTLVLPGSNFANQGRLSIFLAGHSGVEFFFVLSGFIIFYAHRRDFGCPDRLFDFYRKRIVRIYPIFWVILIPFGLVLLAASAHGTLKIGGFLLDLFLIPHHGPLTLPVAWTLQHEIVFYALFGAIIINYRAGIAVLAIWQLACIVVLAFGLLPEDYTLPATTYFGFYNFGFLFGMLVALLAPHINSRRRRMIGLALGLAAAVLLVICFSIESQTKSVPFHSASIASLTYFCLFSLLIVGLLSVENKKRPLLDATLGILGAASYVLYLIHGPLYSVMERIHVFPTHGSYRIVMIVFAAKVTLAVAVSIVIHYSIERQLLERLRKSRAKKGTLFDVKNAPVKGH